MEVPNAAPAIIGDSVTLYGRLATLPTLPPPASATLLKGWATDRESVPDGPDRIAFVDGLRALDSGGLSYGPWSWDLPEWAGPLPEKVAEQAAKEATQGAQASSQSAKAAEAMADVAQTASSAALDAAKSAVESVAAVQLIVGQAMPNPLQKLQALVTRKHTVDGEIEDHQDLITQIESAAAAEIAEIKQDAANDVATENLGIVALEEERRSLPTRVLKAMAAIDTQQDEVYAIFGIVSTEPAK